VGDSIVSGIANGISSGAGKIISAAKDAALDALNAAKRALGIASPSKVFEMEIGQNIAIGMAKGITRSAPMVAAAGATLGRAAQAGANTTNYYLTANYGYQDERSLRDDVRYLQMLYG
jgi:hypothetical protein